MDVGLSAMLFASNSLPTTFGLIAAAIAGAGSLLLIALRFVEIVDPLSWPWCMRNEASNNRFIHDLIVEEQYKPITQQTPKPNDWIP